MSAKDRGPGYTISEVVEGLSGENAPPPGARVDLHTHTNASDGSYPPAELIRKAKEAGLAAIAVTDHDTLAGLPEAVRTGRDLGVRVIPGVELSCRIPDGTLHILGYFMSPGEGDVQERLDWLREQRLSRGEKIIRRLAKLGLELDPEEVMRRAGGGSLGRPHIAQALIDAGHVVDSKEAFEKYLKKGAPAYVDKAVLPKDEAIGSILASGGVPVMAHPYQTNREGDELEAMVEELAGLGLRGIEAHYSLHTPEQTAHYLEMARKYDLRVTGGTDYHGPRKPDISLGTGKGGLSIPFGLVTGLLDELS